MDNEILAKLGLLNPFDGHLMSIEELVVFFLAAYGVVFLLTGATILSRPRYWLIEKSGLVAGLLACPFCLGFWVSLILSFWFMQTVVWSLLYGFAGATTCYVLDVAIRRLEEPDEFDRDVTPD